MSYQHVTGSDQSGRKIICVDLDGTLVKSDMLFEGLCALLKRAPHQLLLAPFWLLQGRAALKKQIAGRVALNIGALPFNAAVLDWLKQERAAGHQIILATASDQGIATAIAEHLGIFEGVLGSDGAVNLKSEAKLAEISKRFGKAFTYAGNSSADDVVWQSASEQVAVVSNARQAERLRKRYPEMRILGEPRRRLALIARAIRVRQWVKNLLIFLPLLMAHAVSATRADGVPLLALAGIAFLSFSFCASGVYVLNDLLDLEADRLHLSKKERPFAAGELSLAFGLVLVPLLFAIGVLLAIALPAKFSGLLCLYIALALSYSFHLKQLVLVDIIVLASLYTLRVLAGGVALEVEVSQWLLCFSMFIFFSLACLKRYSELLMLRRLNEQISNGRGYVASDLEQMAQFGASSGYLSILVLALYVSSAEVTVLYDQPQYLWLICPLLFCWVSRTWLLAHRGLLHEDPIVFAVKDRVSYVVGALCIVISVLALI